MQGEEQRVTAVDIFPDLTERYRLRTTDGGPTLVPKGRYLDEAYADLERRLLWPRIWQLACLTTDLPDPGDWVEYRIADQSYVVLRDLEGDGAGVPQRLPPPGLHSSARAQGAATTACCAVDSTAGASTWTGAVREISSQASFGRIRACDYGLRPVRVGIWNQLVFINPELDGPGLVGVPRSDSGGPGRPSSSRSASARHGSPSRCREIGK